MSTPPPFTIAGYVALVQGLVNRGYTLRSFHDADAGSPHLILRHDVDQSIPIAKILADAESREGWASTWFVLVRTGMYNPFSRDNTESLRAMIAAGHEIGLHLDATCYADAASLEAGAAIECRMLEDMTGAAVRLISFHRPARHLIGGARPIGGRLHTYMDSFFNDMGYCSDSRGEWRYGAPWEHDAVKVRRALQLLTHAIWWVGPEGRDATARIEDFLTAHRREIDSELAANLDVWRQRSNAGETP